MTTEENPYPKPTKRQIWIGLLLCTQLMLGIVKFYNPHLYLPAYESERATGPITFIISTAFWPWLVGFVVATLVYGWSRLRRTKTESFMGSLLWATSVVTGLLVAQIIYRAI